MMLIESRQALTSVPGLPHENAAVQDFMRKLADAGLSSDMIPDVFSVFDEDESGQISGAEFKQSVRWVTFLVILEGGEGNPL